MADALGDGGRGPMVPAVYRVVARRQDLPDTATLVIEPTQTAIEVPQPGQFNMLWSFGVGEVPISVSELDRGDGRIVHTIRAVGATTRALCSLDEGDHLGVRGPFGAGWDLGAADGSDVVVVAGGLGLAPLRPVVEAILSERERFGRAVLLVGARAPEDLLYRDLLMAWRQRSDLDVQITVDHATADWHGDIGVVTRLISRLDLDRVEVAAFVCGPEVMMRFAGAALTDAGVRADRVQVSLERNMVCAIAHCGHCQLGPTLVCREGPVYPLSSIGPAMAVAAL